MNKKAIAILGAIFILIIGTLGVIIYLRSQDDDEPTTPTVTEEPTVETPITEVPSEPEVPTGRAVRLSDDSVVSPIMTYQGNAISYFNRSGQLFQTDLQFSDNTVLLSNKRELAISQKTGITQILWPLAGNFFMAEFENGTKKTWSLFDSSKGAYIDIPSQVYSLDWLPTGDKIMFVWVDGAGKATLNISNPDTTGYQMLTDLYEPDNVISVAPDGSAILFHRTQTQDLSRNTINSVTPDGKTFRTVVADGYNKGIKWSPDSQKFLFTRRDPSTQKFTLWMANVRTGELRNVGPATTVDKTLWSKDSQTIYAGVPTRGVAGEGLTEDTIYQYSLGNMERTEFNPGLAVDARNLFLSPNEDILFFKNAQDNALYYISLR